MLVEKVLQIETLAPMKDDAINMKTPTKFMGKTMNCDEEVIPIVHNPATLSSAPSITHSFRCLCSLFC